MYKIEMQSFLSKIFNFLLPSKCVLCHQFNANVICNSCKKLLDDNLIKQRCFQCALPIGKPFSEIEATNNIGDEIRDEKIDTSQSTTINQNKNYDLNHIRHAHDVQCGSCMIQPPSFDQTITLTCYKEPLNQLIIALKFKKNLSIATILGNALVTCLYQQLHAIGISKYCLVPIPLGKKRLSSRGYNQAAEIAQIISKKTRLPLNLYFIRRKKETIPQSNLAKTNRHKNMNNAFEVNFKYINKLSTFDGGIILVDDVMTSCATMNAAAQILKLYGAKHVIALTAFRTPK